MDADTLLRLAMALTFTLALLGLCAWLVARYGSRLPLMIRNAPGRRLSVVEWRPLDGRHQLLLVRRDNVEHLLLLSANGQPCVVERHIPPASGASSHDLPA